jgi:hypothetical protein
LTIYWRRLGTIAIDSLKFVVFTSNYLLKIVYNNDLHDRGYKLSIAARCENADTIISNICIYII